MAFDKLRFFNGCIGHSSRKAYADNDRANLIAAELAALHAEIEALKAAMPAPKREMGWAVVYRHPSSGLMVFTRHGWAPPYRSVPPLWFDVANNAALLSSALGVGRPALLDKGTMEEVG